MSRKWDVDRAFKRQGSAIKDAIKWIASEHNYFGKLKADLDELKVALQEGKEAEEIKDVKHALHDYLALARSERRLCRFTKKIKKTEATLGEIYPFEVPNLKSGTAEEIKTQFSEYQSKLEELKKRMNVEEAHLVNFASFYEGKIKEKLLLLESLLELHEKQVKKGNQGVKTEAEIKALVTELDEMVADGDKWIAALSSDEYSFRNLKNAQMAFRAKHYIGLDTIKKEMAGLTPAAQIDYLGMFIRSKGAFKPSEKFVEGVIRLIDGVAKKNDLWDWAAKVYKTAFGDNIKTTNSWIKWADSKSSKYSLANSPFYTTEDKNMGNNVADVYFSCARISGRKGDLEAKEAYLYKRSGIMRLISAGTFDRDTSTQLGMALRSLNSGNEDGPKIVTDYIFRNFDRYKEGTAKQVIEEFFTNHRMYRQLGDFWFEIFNSINEHNTIERIEALQKTLEAYRTVDFKDKDSMLFEKLAEAHMEYGLSNRDNLERSFARAAQNFGGSYGGGRNWKKVADYLAKNKLYQLAMEYYEKSKEYNLASNMADKLGMGMKAVNLRKMAAKQK